MPFADNRKNVLSSEISFKLTADGRICRQLRQKLVRLSDAAAPPNVGKRLIVLTNNTLEDLESAVIVFCVEVLLSLPRVVCKRGDRHAHTMATASSAASSFLITFFIMICENLLSSFSDSYFQGLLPAQNQFCRRVRKDAGFFNVPSFRVCAFCKPPHTRAASISASPPAVYSLVPAPPVEGSS